MIFVDQTLCSGCGICADICPNGAITLVGGQPSIGGDACTGCRECVAECPTGALAWVGARAPRPMPAIRRADQIIQAERAEPVTARGPAVPMAVGVVAWIGRELLPRLAPLALEFLDGVLEHRRERPATLNRGQIISSGEGAGRGRRRRHRLRRGKGGV
jgi:ferredoxin